MTTEQSKKDIAPIDINNDELEKREASAKLKLKIRGEKVSKAINIVDMFYKNEHILFKESYIENRVLKEKIWLEKSIAGYPIMILILIFVPAFFILWSLTIMGIIEKTKWRMARSSWAFQRHQRWRVF